MLITRNSFIALAAAAAFVSLTIAGPAYAGDAKAAAACVINVDTGTTQCYGSAAEMEGAVLAQTGAVLVRSDSAAALPSGVRAAYVIADLFTGVSYTGTATSVVSSNSSICASGAVSGNLPAAISNTTSSFKSYLGCTTTLYDLFNQMGPTYGPATVAASLGVMNDRASSYTVT